MAARLAIPVRWESFDGMFAHLRGRGGLCRFQGVQVVIGDVRSPVIDRVGLLAEALSHFDTDAVGMPPLAREKIDRYRDRREGTLPSGKPRRLRLVV